tara:strand:- start:10066 stop:10653 length:588 start_codon:yes stop_codon:yes gene_type:complete
MAFWGSDYQGTTLLDPKRKFRYILQVNNFDVSTEGGASVTTSEVWYAKTVTRPSFAIAQTEHKYLSHTFYYPGSVTWNPIDITMADPQSPNVALMLSRIINDEAGYKVPINSNVKNTMSKASAVTALGGVIIRQIDADGNDIETWTLYNAFITDVKYGDLAYGDDELVEMSMQLRYDWATIASADGSSAYWDGQE